MNLGLTIGLLLAGSYLLGSLPFGLWIAWKWKGVDIRKHGSGNIGATNVGRICGPAAGALAFVLDVGKGLVPPLVALSLGLKTPWPMLAALLAIVGHNYSVFLGFKGGKGIATSLGAMIGAAPLTALPDFALFGLVILTLRYVSVGSIVGAVGLPIMIRYFYPGDWYLFAFGCVAGTMAIYKHRANIRRLLAGTEPKIHLPWIKEPPAPAVPETQAPTASDMPTEEPQIHAPE